MRRIPLASTVFLVAALFALAVSTIASTHADEKPAATRGEPSGEVLGGPGGNNEFRDLPEGRLVAISLRVGSVVDAIRCTWESKDGRVDGASHGGEGGEARKVDLAEAEYVTKVTGLIFKAGTLEVIGSIMIHTNKRSVGPFGETTEGRAFELIAPEGKEISGFRGRHGALLDAVGIVVRPRQ